MPKNRSYYFSDPNAQKWNEYLADAGNLFGAGPFTANTIGFIVPAEGPAVPGLTASAHPVTINGIRRMVVVSPNQYSESYTTKMHEIGHCFGSPDLYPSTGTEHLVGGYAMMADARGARDFHGWHLFRYGWLAQNRTKFLNKAGTYNIDLKKISNSLGEAMIVIPDPHQYAKLWVVEVGRDILTQDDYKQGKNNYLNREGQRLIVYTVEGAPAAPLREIRLAFRTIPPDPLKHLSTAWLDAVSYVAGQSMAPGQAPFGLSVTSKTSDGFQIQITLPNDLSGGVYTRPQDQFSPDGKYVMRFGTDGNISIFKTTTSPESYHWDAINSPKPGWFINPLPGQPPLPPRRFSYENGTIKRLNNLTGGEIDQYQIQANVSGPSYLGVNNSGAPEIFPFVQPPPPTLTSISPTTDTTGGGTEVTLTGTGFAGDPGVISVIFGGAPATNVKVLNATTITCKTPSRIVGPVNVMITTSGGVNPPNTLFTYFAVTPELPELHSILPSTGVTSGGTPVTLYGFGFTGATDVTFGGVAATNLIVLNDLKITCTTPAGTLGHQNVRVNIPGSTSPEIRFFYGATPPPPTLTSASPPTGSNAGGNTVTLTGTGFDAATRVTFGGIEALSFYVVDATTITCTTPAGAGTASVLVTTPGGTNVANSLYTYPTVGSANFGAATNLTVGTNPRFAVVKDLNSDGKPDLAVANDNSGTVSILLGTGTGSFGPATNFPVGSNPYSVVVADFNGDGKLDLATPNLFSDNVSILLGDGLGGFGPATNFPVGTGTQPAWLTVGDFNGDGKPYLAVANNNTNNVSILLGNGAGSFGAATNFTVGTNPRSVEVGDFNGDGKPDLVTANRVSNNVSLLLGNGAGSFGPATNFPVGAEPISMAVRDLNGDGKPDLVTANFGSSNVSILLGNGAGSFGTATNFPVGTTPHSVSMGDLNGDGKPDLAVANFNSNTVSILLGAGTGSFEAATQFTQAANPVWVAVGDLNGDASPDLAVANYSSNNVSIRLNLTVPAVGNYASWIAFYPSVSPSLAGFDQDADGDGVDNGTEYFFGTNPGVGSAGLIAGVKSGSTFTFTHPQNAVPATGVSRVYRWSKDLVTFYDGGQTDGVTTVNFEFSRTTGNPTKVTATVTGESATSLFVDIKVSQN